MGDGRREQVGSHREAFREFKERDDFQPGMMLGSIAVKDLSGNEFVKSLKAESTPGNHAEDSLIDEIIKAYSNDRKLQFAKVNFFMPSSPCKRCISRLPATYKRLKEAICPSGTLFIVFAFKQFYTEKVKSSEIKKSDKDAGKESKAYNDDDEAIKTYKKASSSIVINKSTVASRPPGKKGSVTDLPFITFILVDQQGNEKMRIGDKW